MLIAIQIILAAAGAGAVIALAVDCAAWLKNRISKQHIVVWKDGRRWEASVCACAEKWVRKMPTVPLKDERRLILLDILRKQYRHSALQNWQLAQLISGLSAYGRDLEHAFDPQTFRITEIDDGYALYQVWKAGLADEETMLRLTAEYVDRIVSQRRKPSGLIEYRQGFGDICLVDTIAFVCPLLIRYGMRSGKRELVELAMTQIRSYYRYAYLDQYGLYAHGYHAGTGTPCESVGWGRGSGWYLLGILYCYQELADGEEKSWLKQRMIEGAENILRYEREDGGWSTQLVSKWNYDSECSSAMCTSLIRKIGIWRRRTLRSAD